MEMGLLSDLVNFFKDELLSIGVTGTLSEPRAQKISFHGPREIWNAVTQGKPVPSEPNGSTDPRRLPFRP